MIKGILVTTAGEIKPAELDGSLESFYKTLECDIITCTIRRIGKKEYNVICDDEGLLKGNPKVTAVTKMYNPALVGNLFICNSDGEDWTSLTDDEIHEIMQNTITVFDEGKFREAVVVWV